MSLVPLSDHKIFLQIPASDTTRDDMISSIADGAEGYFQSYTGRQLTPDTKVVLLDGNGTDMLVTPTKPITSVTSVEILDNINNIILMYNTQNLRVDNATGRIKLLPTPSMIAYTYPITARIPVGHMNVRVTYSDGYSQLPPELVLFLKRLVAFFMDPTSAGMSTRKRFGNIEFDARNKSLLPADLRMQLDGYRRIMI